MISRRIFLKWPMILLVIFGFVFSWLECVDAQTQFNGDTRNTTQNDTRWNHNDQKYSASSLKLVSYGQSQFSKKNQVNGILDPTKPQLWYLGPMLLPKIAEKIGARGVRSVVDIRTFNPTKHLGLLVQYAKLDIGICITFRWMNHGAPTQSEKRGKRREKSKKRSTTKSPKPKRVRPMDDVPPTPKESRESIEKIIQFLQTPQAQSLSGKLWVQMYNEISGGPGRFAEKYEDAMFDYATELAKRIRKDAPYVKLCGPAVNGTGVLENSNKTQLTGIAKLRYNRLVRSITWSINYADAVDVHIHAADGPWAAKTLSLVRKVMNQYPGGKNTDIVAWEWSCARFKNRTDEQAVCQVLADIYNTMSQYGVQIAAYGPYKGHPAQADIFQWDNLVDKSNRPHEPFYSFFTDLAKQQKEALGQ